VVIPILIIKFRFKQPLADYGLGLPGKVEGYWHGGPFLTITLVVLPFFVLGARDANVQKLYPFYRPFSSVGQFLLYELTYLPFFIAIEFIFRGTCFSGWPVCATTKSGWCDGLPGIFYFHRYALLIQMLSYTAWHLGKPLPETWGAVVWGWRPVPQRMQCGSIWPIVLSHWLLNVLLDALIVGLV